MGQRPVGAPPGRGRRAVGRKEVVRQADPGCASVFEHLRDVGGKLPREMQIAAVLLMLSTNTWSTATRRAGMARWRGGGGPRRCRLPVYPSSPSRHSRNVRCSPPPRLVCAVVVTLVERGS